MDYRASSQVWLFNLKNNRQTVRSLNVTHLCLKSLSTLASISNTQRIIQGFSNVVVSRGIYYLFVSIPIKVVKVM